MAAWLVGSAVVLTACSWGYVKGRDRAVKLVALKGV